VTYAYRTEIRDGMLYVKTKVVDGATNVCSAAGAASQKFADSAKEKAFVALDYTKNKATFAKTKAIAVGKNPVFQVTSASATAGGVMGGAIGGTVGIVGGAAIGLVPALFTFGLSIPVGAAVGFSTGAIAGSTTGAVSGGALGYGGITYRKEINDGARGVWGQVCTSADYVKTKAADSVVQVKESVKSLVGGGTGGTA